MTHHYSAATPRPPLPGLRTLVVVTLIGGLALAVYALSWPAAEWMERAPQALARIQARVQRLLRQVEPVSRQVGQLTGAPAGAAPTVAPAAGLGARVAAGVQSFLENLVVVAALLLHAHRGTAPDAQPGGALRLGDVLAVGLGHGGGAPGRAHAGRVKICSQHIEALRPLAEFLGEAPGEKRPPSAAPPGP